jgi:hypothetical protein
MPVRGGGLHTNSLPSPFRRHANGFSMDGWVRLLEYISTQLHFLPEGQDKV